jgi:peptidoglycan/LPS O-acetylase OafA/YrhL
VGLLGFTALASLVTLALAMLSFHLYERPFLRLKRFFQYGQRPSLRARTGRAVQLS